MTYTPFFGSKPLDRNILVACILKAGVTLIVAIILSTKGLDHTSCCGEMNELDGLSCGLKFEALQNPPFLFGINAWKCRSTTTALRLLQHLHLSAPVHHHSTI